MRRRPPGSGRRHRPPSPLLADLLGQSHSQAERVICLVAPSWPTAIPSVPVLFATSRPSTALTVEPATAPDSAAEAGRPVSRSLARPRIAAVDRFRTRRAPRQRCGACCAPRCRQRGVAGQVVQCGVTSPSPSTSARFTWVPPAVVPWDARIIGGSMSSFGCSGMRADQVTNERGIDRVLDRLLQCDRAVVVGVSFDGSVPPSGVVTCCRIPA